VCRGMPSCPWDTCGGGPGRGLVGILWGCPAAHAAVHRESLVPAVPEAGRALQAGRHGAVAPDDMPLSARLPFVSCGQPEDRPPSGEVRHGAARLVLSGVGHDAVVPERADLSLEYPSVQLLGLPGARSRCGHRSSALLPVAHHPQPGVSRGPGQDTQSGRTSPLKHEGRSSRARSRTRPRTWRPGPRRVMTCQTDTRSREAGRAGAHSDRPARGQSSRRDSRYPVLHSDPAYHPASSWARTQGRDIRCAFW
jgi:hypothetical protein